MKDPIFTKKLKLPKIEKTNNAKNLFLVIAQIIPAIKKENAKKIKLTFKSKLGLENIHFSSPNPQKNFVRVWWVF